jgi:hypothetical protein
MLRFSGSLIFSDTLYLSHVDYIGLCFRVLDRES